MSRFAGTHLGVRIAVATAGAAAILLAGGCGAGQVAETAQIQSAVPGASGLTTIPALPNEPGSGTGQLLVQNATVAYSNPAGYPKGSTAPLELRVINNSASDVVLTGVQSPLGTVVVGGKGAPVPLAVPSAGASANPSGSPSATPSATPSEAPAPAPAAIDIKIPAGQLIDLSPGAGTGTAQYLQISNLAEALLPGFTTNLTLTFTNSSNPSGSIPDVALVGVPIGPPSTAASRTAVPNEGTEPK